MPRNIGQGGDRCRAIPICSAAPSWSEGSRAIPVTNSYGQTHEIPNLWVAGPGLFPTEGASNPTYTIFAVTQRGAEETRTVAMEQRCGLKFTAASLLCRSN